MLDLAKQAADAEERLTRLYGAIEAGTVDGTDPTLRERVAALKGARDKSIEALDYAKKSGLVPIEIDPVIIERFTRLMREKLVSGDAAGRKAYLSAIIELVSLSQSTRSELPAQTTISGQRWDQMANRPPWFVNLFRNGAQGRDRTTDTAIFSRMLYQLSYLGTSEAKGLGAPVYSQAGGPCPPRFAFRLRVAQPAFR